MVYHTFSITPPTILRSRKQATIEDELAGHRPQSQIERILAQLGITSIPALSLQAKGRIERLWQTFQIDPSKMRLVGIASPEQANLFLETFIPAYNQRFAKTARDPQPAWRALPLQLDLDRLFSTAVERKVKADHRLLSWAYPADPAGERAALPGRLQGDGACHARE